MKEDMGHHTKFFGNFYEDEKYREKGWLCGAEIDSKLVIKLIKTPTQRLIDILKTQKFKQSKGWPPEMIVLGNKNGIYQIFEEDGCLIRAINMGFGTSLGISDWRLLEDYKDNSLKEILPPIIFNSDNVDTKAQQDLLKNMFKNWIEVCEKI